ncbi:hypothetical protein K8I31_14360, partial [bacterium]|nr:hypothetical protein [bacterium]
MSRRRVVITGMGALTPVGNTVDEFWSSLIEGKSGTGPLTRFDSEGFASHVAAELKGFNPDDYIDPKESRRMDHFVQYAMACADQAMKDSGLDLESTNLDRAGVYIGSGIG